ncbi:MAG: class I SAM-dependent methyltransferase [Deltaproteobacteria bacterium]|nr:class I SAM-dependent methyltransferase [Deltaproteobacteria bacterium]
MEDINIQSEYWDEAAASRKFTHPLPWSVFRDMIPPAAKILDYGCGYGRTCSELVKAGYANVTGIDISQEMIKRGKGLNPDLDLHFFDGKTIGFENDFFDACLLIAVLNCIPQDAGLKRTIAEIYRLLRPGGILFISDYPLQSDQRNKKRYQEFEQKLGTFGMFCTDGAVFRHFDMELIKQLLSDFDIVWQDNIRLRTMNGNESDAIQIFARKRDKVSP